MRAHRLIILLSLLSFLPLTPAEETEFLSPDQLQPGMRGYGKTVFAGTQVETFQVEILGVLKNAFPKRDIILARLSGGPLEKTGVISGMSGSPIYIDDKLIGAIAYTWYFTKEPIAGITPITDMLKVLDEPAPPQAAAPASGLPGFSIIQTPIAVTGLGRHAIDALKPLVDEIGAVLLQGGGQAHAESPTSELVPGSTIGLCLARGDLSIFAIGTLTYRDGDKILAFGHPLSSSGTTEIPLVRTVVQTVVPKQDSSFKLGAQVGDPVGAIIQDRPAAVGGFLGRRARMASVRVSVSSAPHSLIKPAEFNFEVVRDRRWFFGLLASGAIEALSEALPSTGDWMVNVALDAYYGPEKPLHLENIYYTGGFSVFPVMSTLFGLSFVEGNPFREVSFDHIEIRVNAAPGRKTAFISSAALGKPQYAPGEQVEIQVNLVPYDGQPTTSSLTFRLPDDATPGQWVTANVCDARASQQLEASRGPGRFRPKDFHHFIQLVQKDQRNTDLFVRALVPREGLTVSGDAFPSLPSSILPVIGAPGRPGVERLRSEVVASLRTQWYLSGNLLLRFKVSEKGRNQ